MIVCEYKNCRQREPPAQPDQGGLIRLIAFRQTVYRRLGPARDALFELGDAVLISPPVRFFPELTLFPIFRRKWSNPHEAVGNGRPSRIPLLHLSLDNLKGNRRTPLGRRFHRLAEDNRPTPRDRTFEDQPKPEPGAKPVTVRHAFSAPAWIPDEKGSGALPFLYERIPSPENRFQILSSQLAEVCPKLADRSIVLLDAEQTFPAIEEGIICIHETPRVDIKEFSYYEHPTLASPNESAALFGIPALSSRVRLGRRDDCAPRVHSDGNCNPHRNAGSSDGDNTPSDNHNFTDGCSAGAGFFPHHRNRI
jgi:hypothetical protein